MVKDALVSVSTLTAYVDIWTDVTGRSFVTFTASFLDKSLQLQSLCLGFDSIPRHTGEEIRKIWKRIVDRYELHQKYIFFVSDKGSDVLKFIELEQLDRAECAGHQLNLLLNSDIMKNDGFSAAKDFIKKLKAIAKALQWKKEVIKELYRDTRELVLNMINVLLQRSEELGVYSYKVCLVCDNE